MLDIQTNPPAQAGLDTTTGHGIDSLFVAEGTTDPWALRCLDTLVNTVINHNRVFYPLPARTIVEKLEDWLLPLSWAEAGKRGLLEMKTDITADEVRLSSDILAIEYQNFSGWAKQNVPELVAWLKYHSEAPRIKKSHSIFVPRHLVDGFWAMRHDDRLSSEIGIPDTHLSYAFDAFVRAIKYHHILGSSTPYFSHPVRDRAFGSFQSRVLHEAQWSWGRYFVQLLREERVPRNIEWLLDRVSAVKGLTVKYNATGYVLSRQPRQEQIELLSTIATESDLPAKLKDSTHKVIKVALEVGTLLTSSMPVVSIQLGLGAVAAEFWSGNVPGKLGMIPVFKGHLVWPELINE